MFKKVIFKSAATTAAVGSALALSLVSSPAMVSTAPELRTVSSVPAEYCEDESYAGDVSTSTSLELGRSMGRYGMPNKATATVTDGELTPSGAVRFTAYNGAGNVVASTTVSVNDGGVATWWMPRNMRARQTTAVSANYLGENCFAPSQANLAFYTILPRGTWTDVSAPNRKRNWQPRVDVAVRSRAPYSARGPVRVTISRNGKVVRGKRTFLRGGERTVFFPRLRPGIYDVRVSYLGNVNFNRSSGADRFRVYRR